jgi:hypothetical protein
LPERATPLRVSGSSDIAEPKLDGLTANAAAAFSTAEIRRSATTLPSVIELDVATVGIRQCRVWFNPDM